MYTILVIDDQLGVPGNLQDIFKMKYESLPYSFLFESCMTGENRYWAYKAIERIQLEQDISLVLLDVKFGSESSRLGLEILERIRHEAASLPVIMLTSLENETTTIVKAIQLGAKDYVIKDPTPEELQSLIQKFATEPFKPWEILGQSAAYKNLRATIARAAQFSDATILIIGERGSGKELVARNIANSGTRAGKAFVDVNCAAIAPNLFEAEMFGAQKGSYTGIDKDRFGFLELANGGVLFLDEIGEMPLEQQSKLLRALELKSFRRIGVSKEIASDFQLICATNADLKTLVEQKKFRGDLYDRIRSLEIQTPPLRACKTDIPLLLNHFAKLTAKREERYLPLSTDFQPAALEAMCQYYWPGNIRELRQAVEHALFMANGRTVAVSDLRAEIVAGFKSQISTPELDYQTMDASQFSILQLDTLQQVFIANNGNQSAMMRQLFPGLKESYFGRVAYDKVKENPNLLDENTPEGKRFANFPEFKIAYVRTAASRDKAKNNASDE